MKVPIRDENVATPKTMTTEQRHLSKSERGLKSPKPTVERVVKAKYKPTKVFL